MTHDAGGRRAIGAIHFSFLPSPHDEFNFPVAKANCRLSHELFNRFPPGCERLCANVQESSKALRHPAVWTHDTSAGGKPTFTIGIETAE